jgi:signal transduction histidine kinase
MYGVSATQALRDDLPNLATADNTVAVSQPRLALEQAALRRVATLVARGSSADEVFETVAAEVASLLESDFSLVGRYESDATLTHIASHPLELLSQLGPQTILDGEDLASIVRRTGRPTCIDYDDAPGPVAALARELGVRCAVGAPILADDRTWGVMALGWTTPGMASAEAAEQTAEFTELVATALANTESRNEITRLAEEQAALRRVATLVARGAAPAEVFSAVTQEVAHVFSRKDPSLLATVIRFDPGPECVLVGASRPYEREPIGSRWTPRELYVSTRVLRTGRSARVDQTDVDAVGGPDADLLRLRGFLYQAGTPVVVEGRVWGAMTLNSGEALPPDTDEHLEAFTELVATAIANAESRNALTRLADEQAALRRVATLVAEGAKPEALFSAVAEEVTNVLGVALSAVVRYGPKGVATQVAAWGKENPFPVGTSWLLDESSVSALVAKTGLSARVADYGEVPGQISTALAREAGVRSAVGAPILVDGYLWGLMMALSTEEKPLPDDAETRLAGFTELIATAISNATARTELIDSRARIVAAGDVARRRIERDLHDGTQQRLVSLALAARAAAAELPPESRSVQEKLSGIAAGLGSAVEELQELSRGIHPAILSDAGLGPALEALALRSPIPVELRVTIRERFPEPVEAAAYFVASESLANAAKHSKSSRIDLTLTAEKEGLLLLVRDDGIGGADPGRGSGLIGLSDRVEALGGSLEITSTATSGTSVAASLPFRD